MINWIYMKGRYDYNPKYVRWNFDINFISLQIFKNIYNDIFLKIKNIKFVIKCFTTSTIIIFFELKILNLL